MNTRLVILKTVLWSLMGVLAVVTVARFVRGLGATTALSDATPWGFWIAFDVMSGVALAAGGFVVAATVYVFGREKYRPFVRPAILTAFLGYLAVAVGLLYDLGLPWHIWHPIIYPQHHSVLFEVAMCVILYLTVLSLEFAPVILEHRWFRRPIFYRIHKLLHGAVIPLVIAGIVLSTLHQSSLGSLFLITPYRLHPLWYSPNIWILFLVSAVALGLMMVTAESLFSAWLFRHRPQTDLLAGFGRAASVVLFVYAGLRLGELAVRAFQDPVFRDEAFARWWQLALFLSELFISALIPAILLSFHRVRTSAAGLAICAGMTILGMIGYRFNVCIVAFEREGTSYFPTWTELAVSLGIVAGAVLLFIFFVERLKVYRQQHTGGLDSPPRGLEKGDYGPTAIESLLPDSLRGPRRYSLAAVAAAAATMAVLPADLFSGSQQPRTPVFATRTVDGRMEARGGGQGHEISLAGPDEAAPAGPRCIPLLMIDGNRDGRLVLFPHDYHVEKIGEKQNLEERDTCTTCHHLNMPFDCSTSCSECHRDMYVSSDIFNHALHVSKLRGNDGCAECHQDSTEAKTRDTARGCAECHEEMMTADSLIVRPDDGVKGFAVGYMDAMHELCVTCHQRRLKEDAERCGPHFADCATCHRDIDGSRFHQMKPYVANRSIREQTPGTRMVVWR